MAANMVVRTNVFSLNAHRNMKNVGLEQQRASNRLSSGYRINTAADDAAGLAISETMRAQIRGLDQASRNAQDGQALILTTEGGMQEITNMLQRVRELLVQASNDTNVDVNRQQISLEINQLADEIGSMQARVQFNTRQTLMMGNVSIDGIRGPVADLALGRTALNTAIENRTAGRNLVNTEVAELNALLLQVRESGTGVGAWAANIHATDWEEVDFTAWLLLLPDAGTGSGDWSETAGYNLSAPLRGQVVDAVGRVVAARTALNGTPENGTPLDDPTGLEEAVTNAEEAVAAYELAVRAARVAAITNVVPAELHFQIGANSGESLMHDFASINLTIALSQFAVENVGSGIVGADGRTITDFIDDIQVELDAVNMERAALGALQNRLDYTMRSLDISSENLQDSESRVRNADMAREMMRFTMSNVLQQAATAMLSQANQIPNNLLQLLR